MKKVFIGVLAALMLFAFTACEQSMPSYKQVEYVTLDQTQEFIKGQPLSAEAFSVTVHYLDGSQDVFPGVGRVTFVDSTETTAKVVTDAAVGVYAKATVAGESDIIGIEVVEPSAFTATVTATAVKRNYTGASADVAKPAETTATLTISNVVITGGETASWTVASDKVSSMITSSSVTIESEEQVSLEPVTKEVTLTLKDSEITYETTVTVEIEADITNPNDPKYEASVTPDNIDKSEVTKLGVVWVANVTDADFKPTGDNGATPAKYDLDDVVTGTTVSTEVKVGTTVGYTIVGLADDMTNKLPVVLEATTDYKPVGTSTIPTQATTGANVTGVKYNGSETETAPLAAEFSFVPENAAGEPNYSLRTSIKLSVTVTDALKSSASSATFHYKGVKGSEGTWTDGTIDIKDYPNGITLQAANFNSELERESGLFVNINAKSIYGDSQITYTKEELEAKVSSTISVYVEYAYDGEFGKVSGTDEVSISVVNTATQGD